MSLNILVLDSLFFSDDFKNKVLSLSPNSNVIFCDEKTKNSIDFEKIDIIFWLPVDIVDYIQKTPNIKWCHSVFSWVDAIISAKKWWYKLTNSKWVYWKSMTEYCLWYILLHSKKAFYHSHNQKKKVWDRIESDTISWKKLLIIWAWSIWSEIALKAKNFGLKTYWIATEIKSIPWFDEVFHTKDTNKILWSADYIISVLPNTPETYNFFDDEKFKLMKKSSVFISIWRWTNVDEKAIYEALLNNEIDLWIMDVFKEEPLVCDSRLWELENLIITPHISWFIQDYDTLSGIFLSNYEKFLNWKKLDNLVEFEKWY